MAEDDTSIRINRDVWRRLHGRKDPGDTFNDVLNRLLDEAGAPPADEAVVES